MTISAVPQKALLRAPFLIGLLFFLCALVFYYSAVLRIDYHKTDLLDLRPADAAGYFAQAKSMLTEGRPSLQIGYDKLPSMTPFGYPALMLAWLKTLPEEESVLAPFRTNQTFGLLLLLAVFSFYVYLQMPLAGGFAALLLVTLPGFFAFCRSSLSEISTSAFVALAFMFAYLGLKEQRRWKIYLSAVFLGLSLNVRTQSLLFAPLLLAMALFQVGGMRLRWFLHCAAALLVFGLAASPVLALNAIQFHSPFKTGYDFWLPAWWFEQHVFFSFRYIPLNGAMLWREFTLQSHAVSAMFTFREGELTFHSTNVVTFFGANNIFVPPFVLLICMGLFLIRINRFVVCAVLSGLSFLAGTLSYGFADARFYLPLFILSIAIAVLPVTWAAENLFARKWILAAVAIFVVFVAACLGYPSRSQYEPTKIDRAETWEAFHFGSASRQSVRFPAQKCLVELFGSEPGIVISDIWPYYLNAILPEGFVAAPLPGNPIYKDVVNKNRTWHYDSPEAVALIRRGLAQSLPVYALFVSQKEMEENGARLPQLDGYKWIPAETCTLGAVILKLKPMEDVAKPPNR